MSTLSTICVNTSCCRLSSLATIFRCWHFRSDVSTLIFLDMNPCSLSSGVDTSSRICRHLFPRFNTIFMYWHIGTMCQHFLAECISLISLAIWARLLTIFKMSFPWMCMIFVIFNSLRLMTYLRLLSDLSIWSPSLQVSTPCEQVLTLSGQKVFYSFLDQFSFKYGLHAK